MQKLTNIMDVDLRSALRLVPSFGFCFSKSGRKRMSYLPDRDKRLPRAAAEPQCLYLLQFIDNYVQ